MHITDSKLHTCMPPRCVCAYGTVKTLKINAHFAVLPAGAQSQHAHMFFHHLPPTSARNEHSADGNGRDAAGKLNDAASYTHARQELEGFAEDLPACVGGVQADVVFRSHVLSKRGPSEGQWRATACVSVRELVI